MLKEYLWEIFECAAFTAGNREKFLSIVNS